MKQNSFILYHDMWDQLKELSNEERWKILEAIFVYHTTWEIVQMDRMLSIVFISIRSMLDRDRDKYGDYIEKQSENGKKWGRPRKSGANPKNPTLFSETQWNPTKAKKADSAIVSESPSESPSPSAIPIPIVRDIVPTETKIIKNEYQENISYMRQQADNIRNEILPDIPNFVKQGQEEEWGKFILYWTSPTSKWTIACEEALNWKIKSFDIKRRFSFWLSNKDKQVTNSSYQHKKTTVWVLDK